MDTEIWKDIAGYEGYYQVSNLGKIRSLDRYVTGGGGRGLQKVKGRMMKLQTREFGHVDILLRKNGPEERLWVHRLVASAFIDNPQNLPIVGHLDNDPSNNCVSNLEWCTQQRNIQHCIASGRFRPSIGETSPFHKLKEHQVLEIRERHATGEYMSHLALEFGVAASTVKNIVTRKKWKHI